ncbi:outer membrane beta-barrel protein [Pedobacter lithocola]|uniref:Outer membrane beta-barrel protein n=2 Tax=Pedobacter lithocola TaxID=1908239 RepID=A0ABV8P631_9SPHI
MQKKEMKSIINFSWVALLFLTLNLNAQGLHLGIKGGVNFNKSSGLNFNDKRAFGYNFGGYIYYDFTKNVGIQLEGLYGRSAVRFNPASQDQANGISEGKKFIKMLSMPVLAKVNVGELFSAVAGPQFNAIRNSNNIRLNNGERAFDSKIGISYTAGIDLGILYFRYNWGNKSLNKLIEGDFKSNQYQIGFRVTVL